jgi:tripartite-type tricarboxylate transporter receptor subunit TctC
MATRRSFLLSTASLLAAGSVGSPASAQSLGKPARILVGYPPGGTLDLVGRQIAQRLRGAYAPSVVVENRPGALQAVSVQALLGAEPDGSTLYLAPYSVSVLYPHVYRKLPYDPLTDLLPVSVICSVEFCIAVAANVPAKNLQEFVALARSNPKFAVYGSLGLGTALHFVGSMLEQAAGLKLTHIPYKGAAPAVQAVLGGEVPSVIQPIPDIAAHHATGKLRVIATSGTQRSQFLPDVPTFEESGFPGLNGKERFGIYVRRNTPAPVVEAASRAVVTALLDPELRASIERMSYYEPRGSSPQEFQGYIRAEHRKWGEVVKASGFTPEG